jgi:hypothetical protein
MTYGEFGRRFGLGNFPPAWANKNTLDAAAQECKSDHKIDKLDLTFLIKSSNKKYPYPSVIDGLPLDKSNPASQIVRAREVAQKIINRFSPDTHNPY